MEPLLQRFEMLVYGGGGAVGLAWRGVALSGALEGRLQGQFRRRLSSFSTDIGKWRGSYSPLLENFNLPI